MIRDSGLVREAMVTASYVEVTWTTTAVFGLVLSLALAVQGWQDFFAVEKAIARHPPLARRWGPRWWVGLSAIVANVALSIVWIGFLWIGLIAMRWPPPPPNDEQALSTWWIGWILITMEILIALVQGWHLFVRSKVEHSELPARIPKPSPEASA